MHDKPAISTAPAVVHGPPTTFISKHVFSLDHKVIGKQYYALALIAVLTGMVLSWLMRIHLGWTNLAIPGLQALSPNGAPSGAATAAPRPLTTVRRLGVQFLSLMVSPPPFAFVLTVDARPAVIRHGSYGPTSTGARRVLDYGRKSRTAVE